VVDPQLGNVSYLGFNGDRGRDFPCVETAAEAESLATVAGFWVVGSPRETELYFEFDNARSGFGRPIVRVYRSSYVESLTFVGLFGIDWPGGGIGRIGPIVRRPLTSDVVLRLLDAVWLDMGGAVLMSRRMEESDAAFVLATHEACLVGGDWGVCDRICQMVTTYTVEKETGAVTITHFVLAEVQGRCRYGT
jgi:hypothetical protein